MSSDQADTGAARPGPGEGGAEHEDSEQHHLHSRADFDRQPKADWIAEEKKVEAYLRSNYGHWAPSPPVNDPNHKNQQNEHISTDNSLQQQGAGASAVSGDSSQIFDRQGEGAPAALGDSQPDLNVILDDASAALSDTFSSVSGLFSDLVAGLTENPQDNDPGHSRPDGYLVPGDTSDMSTGDEWNPSPGSSADLSLAGQGPGSGEGGASGSGEGFGSGSGEGMGDGD